MMVQLKYQSDAYALGLTEAGGSVDQIKSKIYQACMKSVYQ